MLWTIKYLTNYIEILYVL